MRRAIQRNPLDGADRAERGWLLLVPNHELQTETQMTPYFKTCMGKGLEALGLAIICSKYTYSYKIGYKNLILLFKIGNSMLLSIFKPWRKKVGVINLMCMFVYVSICGIVGPKRMAQSWGDRNACSYN